MTCKLRVGLLLQLPPPAPLCWTLVPPPPFPKPKKRSARNLATKKTKWLLMTASPTPSQYHWLVAGGAGAATLAVVQVAEAVEELVLVVAEAVAAEGGQGQRAVHTGWDRRVRRPYPRWPAWDNLVQKLYVLDWEDSDEWYVPMNETEDGDNELEREVKLARVKERKKHLKSLVRYNLVQGRIARGIPAKSREYHFPCRVKKPKDDGDVDYMGALPSEVLYFIFSFLDPVVDLPWASCVCKTWNLICSDPVFWVGPMRRRDIMGNTVMHLAASSIDEEMALRACSYFIQRGALVTTSNRRRATPLTIASTMGHEALLLYLSRHVDSPHGAADWSRSRQRRVWYELDELYSETATSFDAYERVVTIIHERLQALQPLPKPRGLDTRAKGPEGGYWMHKHLPKQAFSFLRSGDQWRGREWDGVGSNSSRRAASAKAARSLSNKPPHGGQETSADDDDDYAGESGHHGLVPRQREGAVETHSTPDPDFWPREPSVKIRGRGRGRLRGRDQVRTAMLKQPGPPRNPPPIDHYGFFPPLPKRRGRGRGRGRGGRGDERGGDKRETAQEARQSGRGSRGRGGESRGRGRGGEGERGRGRGGKDKGKEKVDG